ncbi:hypothetical protein ACSU1N_05110 [Thermogladius sp. 4427co]|uniref:hypothetical protein n=1 Tax=Thermogladius sp. 4427co TaxID=3450718 RepID=UPI003F792388
MPQGVLSEIYNGKLNADLYYTFVNWEKQVSAGESVKIGYTLDTPKPVGVKAEYGVLELLVETESKWIDWKVKINGLNIAREFKPAVSLRSNNRFIHKLIYDIKSVLNTPESLSKPRIHMTVRLEGGGNVYFKAAGFIGAYADNDAVTRLKYYSGLVLLGQGEPYTLPKTDNLLGNMELALYSTRPVKIRIQCKDSERAELIQGVSLVKVDGGLCDQPTVLYESSIGQANVLILGYLVNNTIIKMPRLSLANYALEDHAGTIRLLLDIVNVGEAKPDEVIIVLLNRGLVKTVKKTKPLSPGERIEESLIVPREGSVESLTIRLVWKKLARTDFEDYVIQLGKV